MTNELAIRILTGDVLATAKQTQEAVITAVKALSQPNDGDTISRQAAIDALMEILDEPNHAEFLYTDEICKALNGLPSVQSEQRWIPCSERLPEEYGEYYITWTTSLSEKPFIAICEGEVTSEYDFEHERFKFEWLLEDYIKAYPDVAVIAWMPLVEPYKGEQYEQKSDDEL